MPKTRKILIRMKKKINRCEHQDGRDGELDELLDRDVKAVIINVLQRAIKMCLKQIK